MHCTNGIAIQERVPFEQPTTMENEAATQAKRRRSFDPILMEIESYIQGEIIHPLLNPRIMNSTKYLPFQRWKTHCDVLVDTSVVNRTCGFYPVGQDSTILYLDKHLPTYTKYT